MRPGLATDYTSPDPQMLAFRDSARLNALRGWELCFYQIQSLGLEDKRKPNEVLMEDWETTDDN